MMKFVAGYTISSNKNTSSCVGGGAVAGGRAGWGLGRAVAVVPSF